MRRWYITRKESRELDGDEREEAGLPRYTTKRNPEAFIEWTAYLNVKTRKWHLEHLFATAFSRKGEAQRGLDGFRQKIEYDVVTLMMIGKRDEADEVNLLPDAEPRRIPKVWPKDRRKVPMRVIYRQNRWPYNKGKAVSRKEKVHEKNQD